jgi:fucose permease
LLSFLGAILPGWGYHVRPHYVTVGNYFLSSLLGGLLAGGTARLLLKQFGIGRTLSFACTVAFISFVSLAFTAPPVSESWRLPGLVGLGFGGGTLNAAIFHAISPAYRLNRAATVNLAGAFLGIGSCLVPVLVAGTFHLYSVTTILLLIALIPGAFAIFFARAQFEVEPFERERTLSEVIREFRVPSAVFLSLLLFFHFGNEWAVAGWLPLFLTVRLGINPSTALVLLTLYWSSLVLGRVVAQAALPRISHWRLLFGAALAAVFGCLVLAFTNNMFGASLGTLFLGLGFAPIYPLVVEQIGNRFPYYHPSFFNGVFSIALAGGGLAPATLGYAAESLGIRVVMVLPALGTLIVLILVVVIRLEARIADWTSAKARNDSLA